MVSETFRSLTSFVKKPMPNIYCDDIIHIVHFLIYIQSKNIRVSVIVIVPSSQLVLSDPVNELVREIDGVVCGTIGDGNVKKVGQTDGYRD